MLDNNESRNNIDLELKKENNKYIADIIFHFDENEEDYYIITSEIDKEVDLENLDMEELLFSKDIKYVDYVVYSNSEEEYREDYTSDEILEHMAQSLLGYAEYNV